MKTILAAAAAVGLSMSAAVAGCPGHVSASVDKETVVASIPAPAAAEPVKTDKDAE